MSSLLVQLNGQSVHSALSTTAPQDSKKWSGWRNVAFFGELWVASVLCPMGFGADSLAGRGDGEVLSHPEGAG